LEEVFGGRRELPEEDDRSGLGARAGIDIGYDTTVSWRIEGSQFRLMGSYGILIGPQIPRNSLNFGVSCFWEHRRLDFDHGRR